MDTFLQKNLIFYRFNRGSVASHKIY